MPGKAPGLDFTGLRFHAGLVDGASIEIGGRAERRGVLARIKADAFRIAIGVDHVTMEVRLHHGRTGQEIGIKPVHMPVGIGQFQAGVVEPCLDVVRNECACMRHAKNDRAITAEDVNRLHGHLPA